jgi:hypothetical protein
MIVPASMARTINTAADSAEASDPTPIRHPPVMGEAARASPGPAGVLAYPRPRTLTAPAAGRAVSDFFGVGVLTGATSPLTHNPATWRAGMGISGAPAVLLIHRGKLWPPPPILTLPGSVVPFFGAWASPFRLHNRKRQFGCAIDYQGRIRRFGRLDTGRFRRATPARPVGYSYAGPGLHPPRCRATRLPRPGYKSARPGYPLRPGFAETCINARFN